MKRQKPWELWKLRLRRPTWIAAVLIGCAAWAPAQGCGLDCADSAPAHETTAASATTPLAAPLAAQPASAPDNAQSVAPTTSSVAPNPVANTTTNTTTNTPSTASIPWQSHIESAAALYGIDYFLLQAIVHAESRFIANAISPSGAVGLMQLMPPTAASVGALQGNRKAIRKQLLDPATNLRIGARYLKSLLQQFEGRLDLALAAYNAGAGNVKKAGNQVPNNRETPKFVAKVMQLYTDLRTSSLLRMPQDSVPTPTAATALSINSNTGATTGAPSTTSSSSSTSSSNSPPNTIATKVSQPEPNPALSP